MKSTYARTPTLLPVWGTAGPSQMPHGLQAFDKDFIIIFLLFFFFSLTKSLLGKEKAHQMSNDGVQGISLCGIKEHPYCLLCKYNMHLTHPSV